MEHRLSNLPFHPKPNNPTNLPQPAKKPKLIPRKATQPHPLPIRPNLLPPPKPNQSKCQAHLAGFLLLRPVISSRLMWTMQALLALGDEGAGVFV